jgi:hypothetical protein
MAGVGTATVALEVLVEVDVRDPELIERVTGPTGDEWRAHMYPDVKTKEDVMACWAYACVMNNAKMACEVDGWADAQPIGATFHVVGASLIGVEEVSS